MESADSFNKKFEMVSNSSMDVAAIRSQYEGDGNSAETKCTLIERVLSWLLSTKCGSESIASDAASLVASKCRDLGKAWVSQAIVRIAAAVESEFNAEQTKDKGLEPTVGESGIHPKTLDAIPSLLSALPKRTSDGALGENGQANMSFPTTYDASVFALVKIEWPSRLITHFALVFADMSLQPVAHERLVSKLTRYMKESNTQNLCSIVRHLLIQAKMSSRMKIIQEIISHMNTLDASLGDMDGADWQQRTLNFHKSSAIKIEGSCILQICFAVRQTKELGEDILGWIKASRAATISPFVMSLVLAISQIHRFEDASMDFLKSLVLSVCKDAGFIRSISWISNDLKHFVTPINMWAIFKRVMIKSEIWNHLVSSLVHLAFVLLESGPTMSHQKNMLSEDSAASMVWSPFDIGTWMLLELNSFHPIVRQQTFELIITKISMNPACISGFAGLMEGIARQWGSCVLAVPHISTKIQDCLQALGQLSDHKSLFSLCNQFLWAISPLFQTCESSLRESLLMALRKAMFNKEIGTRKVAIATLMHQLKISIMPGESGSQSQARVVDSEIFYVLNRGMSQQCEIRQQLYEGFQDIIECQPWLGQSTLSIFLPQLSKYYEESLAVRAPLRLEDCFDGCTVVEPLPSLMAVVVACRTCACEDDASSIQLMDDLLERLLNADLADFEIDGNLDFLADSDGSRRNMAMLEMIMSIYAASMDYVMVQGHKELTDKQVEMILGLFKRLQKAQAFLKDKLKGKKGAEKKVGEKKERKGVVSKKSHISLSSSLGRQVAKLSCLFGESAVANLRANLDLSLYLLNDTITVLNQLSTHQIVMSKAAITESLCELGNLLFCEILKKRAAFQQKCLLSSGIDCFGVLFALIHARLPDSMCSLLTSIVPAAQGSLQQIEVFIADMRDLINDILAADPSSKDALILLQCLTDLWTFINKDPLSKDLIHAPKLYELTAMMQGSLLELWQKYQHESITLSKGLVSFICKMQSMAPNFSVLKNLVTSIQASIGVVMEENEEYTQQDSQESMGEMDDKNVNQVVSGIVVAIEFNIEQVRWMTSKLKFVDNEDALLKLETVLFKNVSENGELLYNLLRSELPPEAAETLYSAMIKLFKVVNNLLKHKTTHLDFSRSFENMIHVIADKLRECLNETLPNRNEDQEDQVLNTGKKGASVLFKKRKRYEKESKTMPVLIFETEQFDRHLIALHKKGNANLLKYVKRSTARDFKIEDKSDHKKMKMEK
ncbi:FANCI helical domain 2-domain-containing protein [Chytriomyces sp. MP71]|nr:FANCI helical domain 2-domain-containing protein [Chytriomyces sp. MP71]